MTTLISSTRTRVASLIALAIIASVSPVSMFDSITSVHAEELMPTATSTTATINIVTVVVNDNGGSNDVSDFGIHISGAHPSPSSVTGSAAPVAVTVNAGEAYTMSVPTLTYAVSFSPDCASTLTAGSSVTCTVTLDDIAPIADDANLQNLVQNPDFEIPSAANASIPDQWEKGYDDAGNAVTYTFPAVDAPASDISSGNAAQIVATSFGAGSDAKWYFAPVQVSAGQQYAFSDSYLATVDTELVAVFCMDKYQNGCSYSFAAVDETPDGTWHKASAIFTVPTGKSYMTVFHRIAAPGTLIVDNYALTILPPPSPFANGFVTLTFDDSLASQYINARNPLLAGNVKATFYAISHFIEGMSLANPSLEEGDATPTGWAHAGSASSTYAYPVAGHTGSRAAEVSATTAGSNAAWYFNPISILPDSVYSFTEWYQSTGSSELVAQVTMKDGTVQFLDVTTSNGSFKSTSVVLPSTLGAWQSVQAYFYVPENAKSITVYNRLTGTGSLTIDDASFGLAGYMTDDQLLQLQADGHELGGHSQTHPDLATIPADQLVDETAGNRADLRDSGASPVVSYAYPYGSFNAAVQEELKNAGYTSGRTVMPGFNGKTTAKYALFSQSVNADTTLDQVAAWIDEAKADKTWLILTFHDVQSDLSNLPYGTTPQMLADIIATVNAKGMPVKTMREGLVLMADPSLTIVTNVVNAHGGTATVADVTVTVTGTNATPSSFVGSTTPTIVSMKAGNFTATTTVPADYQLTVSGSCSGTMSVGQQKTCTFTYSDAEVVVAPVTHIISATSSANGSISPAGDVTVTDGMDQAFTITADSGYHILDVLVDGVSVGAVSTYTFTANAATHTIAASFEKDVPPPPGSHTIQASAGANGSISPSGAVSVTDGSDQSFTISADTGYHILDVQVNGASIGTTSTYTFTNNMADGSIAVTFEQDVVVLPPAACADGLDNDGDTLIDTSDPGCSDANDTDETDPVVVPPPTNLPHCATGSTYDPATDMCVTSAVSAAPTCEAGFHLDTATDVCTEDVPADPAEPVTAAPTCAAGTFNPATDMCEVPAQTVAPTCDTGFHLDGAADICVADPVVTPPSSGGGSSSGGSSHHSSKKGGSSKPKPTTGSVLGAATTTPVAGFVFTLDLTVGAVGNEVVELQKRLVAEGFLTMPAGIGMGTFGPLTKSAVQKYQTAHALPATGFVGPMTRAALNGGATVTTTPTIAELQAKVKELMALLASLQK